MTTTGPRAPEPSVGDGAGAAPRELQVRRLDPGLPLPARAHAADAGLDLSAAEAVDLAPGHRALVGTGIAVGIPEGYVGLIHPRSGLAARSGLSIVNAPGTVDAGYTGELRVNLVNLDPERPVRIERGDRIAQLLVQRVEIWPVREVETLDETERGDRGHGSSGGHAGLSAAADSEEGPSARGDDGSRPGAWR